MDIEKMDLNDPSDKYFFIAYKTGDINHRITWGRNQQEVPFAVTDLYILLKSLIKKEGQAND